MGVARDGSLLVVGAWGDEDPNGEAAGSAYVFERSDGTWSEQANLTASDGDSEDSFGLSVGVAGDGDTIVLGAPGDEDPNGDGAGSAYVFERSGEGWSEQAKLAASDGDSTDSFGSSVAIADDGATVVVSASRDEDPTGEEAGSAYVFERSDGTWNEQAKLVDNDGYEQANFGSSTAISGDGNTVVIGDDHDETSNGVAAGSAYVFERSGEGWSEQAKLTDSDGEWGELFGTSLAVAHDGTTVVIGALQGTHPDGTKATGSVHVFERSDGGWNEQAELTASDAGVQDGFGSSVGVVRNATTVVVGASDDREPNGDGVGSAYVFERGDGGWSEQAKLAASDGDANDAFGSSVAVPRDGGMAVVGTPYDEDPNGKFAGSAYVFEGPATGTDTQDGGEADSENDGASTGSPSPGFGVGSMLSAASVLVAGTLAWNRHRASDDSG